MTIKAQPVFRVCVGCGAEGDGVFPVGWLVEYDRAELDGPGPRRIVGERAYCSHCQMKGAHRDRADA